MALQNGLHMDMGEGKSFSCISIYVISRFHKEGYFVGVTILEDNKLQKLIHSMLGACASRIEDSFFNKIKKIT